MTGDQGKALRRARQKTVKLMKNFMKFECANRFRNIADDACLVDLLTVPSLGHRGQCNQICGVNHAYMPIVLKSVSKDDYKKWLADAKLKFANVDSNIKVVMNNEKVIKENN